MTGKSVIWILVTSHLFPRNMPPRIKTIPIPCMEEMDSPRTRRERRSATGSSDAARRLPRPGEIWGMPVERSSGGRATPNRPRMIPKGARSKKRVVDSKNTGGKRKKVKSAAVVAMMALFHKGGTLLPNVLSPTISVV